MATSSVVTAAKRVLEDDDGPSTKQVKVVFMEDDTAAEEPLLFG